MVELNQIFSGYFSFFNDADRESCRISNSIEEFVKIESWLLLIIVYTAN